MINNFSIFKNCFFNFIFLLAFLCFGVAVVDQTGINADTVSGGDQIIVSPINILLDLGESSYVDVLVLDSDGSPIEGRKMNIIPQDTTKVAINSDNFFTNKSGYINFSILGKQQGDTVVMVSDGVISSYANVAIRNLIQYLLPHFYGNMQLNFINPTEDTNYVKIQFHENSERSISPVIIVLEGKEMKTVKLSEEIGATLSDGWIEVYSTSVVFGGVWTNKGYLPINRIDKY